MSTAWTKVRSEHANLHRKLGANHPDVIEKRVELRASKLESDIQRALAEAPPLTDAQIARIAALFQAGGA